MSQFADAIIRSPFRARIAEVDRIARLLEPPFELNHKPHHPAVSEEIAAEAKQRAQVYDFDLASSRTAEQIMSSARRSRHVFETCNAPHERMLIEYFPYLGEDQDRAIKLALLVEGNRDLVLITVFIGRSDGVSPMFQFNYSFNEATTIGHHLVTPTFWFPTQPANTRDEWHLLTKSVIRTVAASWAFLAINGAVVTSVVTTRAGRLSRRGRKNSFSAIHSYNRVTLNLPGAGYSRNAERFKSGHGVRLHDVRGHWRELEIHGQRVLRWIAAFWRGDARLGIVVKERSVKYSPSADERRSRQSVH